MQNTKLDTTVSQLLQDNSTVEYVEPKKNPIATTQRGGETPVNELFDFKAEHNGEACIETGRSWNRASILVHRCDDVCDFRVQCRHNTQAS